MYSLIIFHSLDDEDDIDDLDDINDDDDLDLDDLDKWLDDDSYDLNMLDRKLTPEKWLKRQVRQLWRALGKYLFIFLYQFTPHACKF